MSALCERPRKVIVAYQRSASTVFALEVRTVRHTFAEDRQGLRSGCCLLLSACRLSSSILAVLLSQMLMTATLALLLHCFYQQCHIVPHYVVNLSLGGGVIERKQSFDDRLFDSMQSRRCCIKIVPQCVGGGWGCLKQWSGGIWISLSEP
ncbi:uncharacterized protein EDB91DRAFT_410542 [Suillus paluster]|uniref:uncharacterized protein n=1 Tax=Suillus paluster TaxID=48578 RepID=UPI001B866734|nr:uncharacterized protein EDB91DRAFT_410542 [Suillus paluster]KAG1753652.1 hypothetical protein EDB91DRAFT_410542 [Suillus paluster]